MFKGFKEFIAQGNVIDLAVAVVIGGAFTHRRAQPATPGRLTRTLNR